MIRIQKARRGDFSNFSTGISFSPEAKAHPATTLRPVNSSIRICLLLKKID